MNSLFISEYWPPDSKGGGEESASALAHALSEQGVQITVLTSICKGLPAETQQGKVRVLRRIMTGTNPGSFLSNIQRTLVFPFSAKKQIKKLLTKETFDALHYVNVSSVMGKTTPKITPQGIRSFVHTNSPLFFCPKGTLMYSDKKECHYTCTPLRFVECFLHSNVFGKLKNSWYYKYNPALWLALYALFRIRLSRLKQFETYIAVSGFMQQKLLEIGITKNRIHVISNIVELQTQSAQHKTPHLLYLGDYLPQKGVRELLQALTQVRGTYTCNFYGSGPLCGEMQNFITQHSLTHVQLNTRIPQEKVLATIAAHDIIIQPSLVPEAMSRTVLQAMAAGKAVITSNRGGMRDYIQQGKHGLLINPDKPKEIAHAIETCLASTTREKLGRNARKKIQQTSSAKKVTDEFLRLYNTN